MLTLASLLTSQEQTPTALAPLPTSREQTSAALASLLTSQERPPVALTSLPTSSPPAKADPQGRKGLLLSSGEHTLLPYPTPRRRGAHGVPPVLTQSGSGLRASAGEV
jgi:hypothetical protein